MGFRRFSDFHKNSINQQKLTKFKLKNNKTNCLEEPTLGQWIGKNAPNLTRINENTTSS